MALINCPECQKEISDKVKACPNCGYPFSESNTQKVVITDVKLKSSKVIPKIVIAGISIIVIFFITNGIRKNNYQTNLGIITKQMLDGGIIAEELTGLTHDVWYNTIYKKQNSKTDKFTGASYGFNSDFNLSLSSLSLDSDVRSKKRELENMRNKVEILMKKLQNPPKSLQNSYNDLDKLYRSFISYVELAINPSGSLTSFTSNVNKSSSDFIESYSKLKLYIK